MIKSTIDYMWPLLADHIAFGEKNRRRVRGPLHTDDMSFSIKCRSSTHKCDWTKQNLIWEKSTACGDKEKRIFPFFEIIVIKKIMLTMWCCCVFCKLVLFSCLPRFLVSVCVYNSSNYSSTENIAALSNSVVGFVAKVRWYYCLEKKTLSCFFL